MMIDLKCIWFWKWKEEGPEYMKVGEKFQKALKERPNDFPKLSPGIHHRRGEGFRLVDGTYEQLLNLVSIWAPVEEWRLEVYFEGDDISKAWTKWQSYS